jgi:hypothetical protein
MNFVYLRSSRLHIFQIWALIHALATRGRKEGGEKLHCIPETYPKSQGGACAFLLHFWLLGVWSVVWNRRDRFWKPVWPVLETGLTGFDGTGLTGFGNWPERFVPRVGTCSGGACICAGGALVCFGGLCSLLEHGFVSDVSSRCPCLRGPRLVFFKWSCSLLFRLLIACWSFFLFVSFMFPFLLDYKLCVLSMHSSRGRLRTMSGSRTDGWSLPFVTSNWQRCVDWFLAK